MSLSPRKKLLIEAGVELGMGFACIFVGLGVLWIVAGRDAPDISVDLAPIIGFLVLAGLAGAAYALWSWLRPPAR